MARRVDEADHSSAFTGPHANPGSVAFIRFPS
jgi:hypothetical protein